MKVVLASIFRDSCPYLERYFAQVRALRDALLPDKEFRAIWCEGDSMDATYDTLKGWADHYVPFIDLFQYHHGGPKYPSEDIEDRWRRIALVDNAVMERLPKDTDALIYVESDLIWQPQTMVDLVTLLKKAEAVAPMCFHGDTKAFYDTWGYRGRNGVQFTRHPPYHDMLDDPDGMGGYPGIGIIPEDNLYPLLSAGSCVVMRGEVARVARFGELDCIVGLGRSIREHGYGLWLAPDLAVIHPTGGE